MLEKEQINEILDAMLSEDELSCASCYYVHFDQDAYPCSRCIHNAPTESKYEPMRPAHDWKLP